MATITVTLPIGWKTQRTSAAGTETVTHREAVLRELTPGDLINAGSDAEKVIRGDDGGYHLVQSPTLIGLHMLRRQIVRIGDIEGPMEVADLLRLAMQDFDALQNAADNLDAAALKAMQTADERGRSEAAS